MMHSSKCEPCEARVTDKELFDRWFAKWLADNGVTDRTFAPLLRTGLATAGRKRLGRSPLNFVDVMRFPDRYRNSFILAFAAWCSSLPESVRASFNV